MIYSVLLIIHVISGTAALVGGLLAILARKSKGLHTKSGIVYYMGMYGVSATALVMTIIKFNPFLLAIAVFALYLTYTGKKSIDYYRRKGHWQSTSADLVPGYIALGVSVFMMGWPLSMMILSGRFVIPVLAVFGLILFLNALQDIRFLRSTENLFPRNKNFLVFHIGKMGGAYISTVTAFLINNISFDPAWIGWLLPTVVGTPLIVHAIRSWKQKLRLA